METKNDLIVLEQLPIIKYKLEQLSVEIKEKVDNANKLVVNEDTVKEVKQVRANLTKEFNELESQRKQVKQAIMSKYDEFEEIYKENVSNIYKQADSQLKEKIDNVENLLKEEKKNELFDFAMEYFVANNIQDYVSFDDIGLNITLSASMKSLKEEIIAFCEKVKQDLELIKMEEYRDEILYEYKKNHGNFAQCKMTVIDRHKEIDRMNELNEEKARVEKENKKNGDRVQSVLMQLDEETGQYEVVTAPKEIIEDNEIITVTFTINDTKENVVKVREFMKKEGIKYE